ncbi:MAG: hypothetical protein ACI95K_002213, partial [Lentimonas sp.]
DLKEYNYSPEDYSELRDFVIKAQSILKVPIHIGS